MENNDPASISLPRTSELQAPIMLLTGHDAPIYAMKFSPCGRYVASGSHDKKICEYRSLAVADARQPAVCAHDLPLSITALTPFITTTLPVLWDVYGECNNLNVLDGHKNVVLDLHWNSAGTRIVTASADKTVGVYDVSRGIRTKKYGGHSAVVNSCHISRLGEPLAVSGGDDNWAMVWDMRARRRAQQFLSAFSVLAVSFSAENDIVFTSGVDNVVRAWDRRREEIVYSLEGHTDTVTGMSLSPDGAFLLTNSMDKSLICWDVRNFVTGSRLSKQFRGHQHNLEKALLKCSWSSDGEMISCGSSDHVVHLWDFPTTDELYHLPGHTGSVNEVVFHPTEPIVGSCGSDKLIYLGEL